MRYLLRFSLAFAVIAVVLALVGFVLPRNYRVAGGVAVDAPPEAVFPLVGDLARWREWSPLTTRDPQMETQFSAVTTGAGAWTQWRSAGQGGGRAEILETRAPELVRYRMSFAGLPLTAEGSFSLVATGGGRGTSVTWTSEGRVGWSPLARWFGLLARRAEAREVEAGLAALRVCAEKRAEH
ncbi:MAG TPA: SRPBCC family protein [Opitutaceae bacterium]|nr:SRPBCC family protein [Opitutaceae bacterium]